MVKWNLSSKKTRKLVHHDTKKSTSKKLISNKILLFILINAILGSSLFYLPGLSVIFSGPAAILAWILVFVIAMLVMFYVGELITMHPSSGGTYEYCKQAYGRFIAFIAGWLTWVAGNFGMALGVIAAAQYFVPGRDPYHFMLQAVFVVIWVLVLNFMAYRGVDAGVTMLVAFGIITVIVVTLMIVPSFIDFPALFQGTFATSFNFEFLKPFFPQQGGTMLVYLGISVLFITEAFFGFETIAYLSNEAKDKKTLHKVLFKAVIICGAIMALYVFSSLGTVSFHDYSTNLRPFAVQAFNTMGAIGQQIVVFGMYLVIIGSVAAWPITGSRLIQAMASDRLFPKNFVTPHHKHKSPYKAIIFQTLAVLFFSWILFRGYTVGWRDPYQTVYLVYVIISLLVISLVLFTVPILRKKQPDLERPFKAPFPTIGPVLIVALFLSLIINWLRFQGGAAFSVIGFASIFLVLALPIYFLVEMLYDQKAIRKVNEFIAIFLVLGEILTFPLGVRKKILKKLGSLKGKTVLEYGCSVGTLTKRLAISVLPRGKVIATDFSEHKIKITKKRTSSHKHVQVHHHNHLNKFSLKLSQKADHLISVGMLSYMQNPNRILKDLASQVKKNGKIIFVDFDNFFFFISNVSWMKDDKKLKQMFYKAGFSVDIDRRRGILWQNIIITGKKR
ncbi:amino acid permease [Candidatus Woesearchaeota archaeon]|nr:amino acid permease [Candidatus Woesearchaeota archaeon]